MALFALLVAGCRFDGVPPPPPWPEATAPCLPFRVAVAPVRVDAQAIAARHAGERARRGSAPDPEQARRGVVEALRAARVFARVEARGGAGASPRAVADAAWGHGDDLVLELDVLDQYDEYLGHSNYVGWFVVYASFVWPAWWVPFEYYGAGLTVRATLRNVLGDATLFERTYELAPEQTRQELTPSDRELAGFLDLGALWNVEESLEDSNWRAISRAVGPHAWRAFEEALVRDLRARVAAPLLEGDPVEREEVLRRARKRLAVVVGASRFDDPSLGGGAHAADDARAMAALFARPEAGGLVEGRGLVLLTDEQATRAAVLDAIAAVASRATPSDEVVVYVASLGATLPPPTSEPPAASAAHVGVGALGALGPQAAPASRPAVLLHDARAQDLAGTALLVEDLGRALAAIPAGRVLVVLDASFGAGPGASRTLTESVGPAPRPAVRAADLARALRLGPGRAALLAARPDQPARVLPGAQAGLFGEVLRAAIGGAADHDGDGRVTLGEVVEHVRAGVLARAALEGFEQEPSALELDEAASAMGWPR